MQQNIFQNKKIAVVGRGVEGLSSAEFLKEKGADVTVLDKKDGEDYLRDLDKYDLVVRSPGVKPQDVEKFVLKDKITSQTRLFFDLCPSKIIGVTGTKGKGTTSSLIYEMLKKEGFDAYLGGNIGKPPLEFLDNLNVHSIVVLELSSFQLLDLEKSPNIAVMLMITSEHLNWHKDLEEYLNAKRNILRFQKETDFAIINKDYLQSRESDVETVGQIYYISREDEAQKGSYVKENAVFITGENGPEKIVNVSEILLPGAHNLENVCSASMAAYLAGVRIHNIAQVLRTFKGLEHRLELVAEINGVKYYDDSFATTPESTIAAIDAFTTPEILILGGSSKNSDLTILTDTIKNAKNIKAIIGIGAEWEKIKEQLLDLNSEILVLEGAKNMQAIVLAASKLAQPDDVVLLSPACASFGMFKDYKDRGNQFKKEVLVLKQNESN